jgi:prepilin-type N-terminal cleavage/methylation domain-containing protein
MNHHTRIRKQNGYTLIELVITIVILGMMTYFLGSMCVELLAGSTQQTEQVEMVNLAISKMEEATRIGVNLSSQAWTSEPPYQWRRSVTTLKSYMGNPTLVTVAIEVKDALGQTFSLINHIEG